jgi:ribose transport system substrate-binding protein
MNKNKMLAGLFSAALLALTSCAPLAHNPNELYILVTTNLKVSYWQTALAGLNHAANELRVKIDMVGPDTYDPKAEHDEFQKAMARKPSGILVSAADASIMAPDIDAAVQAGIPVLTLDSDAPNSKRLLFVGTDNYNAGMLGGQLAVKLLNGKGNVVIFTMPAQSNLNERLQGYKSAFDSHPGIKITDTVDIQGDPTKAFDRAKDALDKKEKVDAFVCLEAIACPEVGEVVSRANMGGKIAIIGMDTDQRTISLIQKGVISATIAQKPFTMGYFGVKLVDELHHHPPTPLSQNYKEDSFSPLPTFVDTGAFVVDKDSVGSFIQQTQAHGGAQ